MLAGLLPLGRGRVVADVLAGATLAAIAVPEALGYARIAGMPLQAGLYTLLLPALAFALFGGSRHLVVGADSATAALLAAGLAAQAAPGSDRYVQLAGTVALMTAGLLLIARLARLGFLAEFLSQTVLVGFLTGVGVNVALRQLPEMLGVEAHESNVVARTVEALESLGRAQGPTVVLSVVVVAVMLGTHYFAPRVPGALVALVGAIVVSVAVDLPGRGVHVVGTVPSGLPGLHLPALDVSDATALFGIAMGMVVVILAQSAATARAYANREGQDYQAAPDLVGLGVANTASAFTGSFPVNGSPTKTQIVYSAGGRSQLAMLTAAVVAVVVVLVATGPLAVLPSAALAGVVFAIGLELMDMRGLRRILSVRRSESVVAVVTAVAVVALGVLQGVVLAVVVSIIDHLRHSYSPRNSVLVKSVAGHWHPAEVAPGVRTAPGLVVYRFGTGLYFANADRLAEDVHTLARDADTDDLRWFCLDAAAIGDVDYSSAGVLVRVQQRLSAQGCRLVFSGVHNHVRRQLRDYGVARDGDVFYATAGEAYEHLGADGRVGGDDHSVSWPAEPPPEAPVPPGSASAR